MDFSSNSRTSPATLRWWVRGCWVVGLVLFLSQLVEIPWRSALRGYDNTFNYLWLRSAMAGGDWDFRDDLQQCNTLTPNYRASALALPRTETGRIPNKYGVGWAVLTLPFYLMADATVTLGRLLGVWTLSHDGYNPVYQVFIQTGHAALAVLALWLAIRVVRGWVGEGAVAGVMAVWAASPLLYYQTSDLSMSHGAAFFAVALGAYGLQRARGSPALASGWLLAGAGFGLAAVTRFELAIFMLLPAWAMAGLWQERRAAVPRALAGLAAGALPFILLQMLAWHVVYGHWLVFSYGAEGERFNWLHPALGQSLFSPWHGLYYWHPLLLVATAGLGCWIWGQRGFAWAVGLAFAGTMYVNAAWWCWWFGSAFGNRAYDAAILPLMAGLAWIVAHLKGKWKPAFWTVATLAAVWNIHLVALYRLAAISRNGAVTWSEMFRGGF